MSKLTVHLVNALKLVSPKHDHLKIIGETIIKLQFMSVFKAITNFGIQETVEEKLGRYWLGRSVEEIITEADELFQDGKYLEVYELLNRLKFCNNVEVQWRIARALFKLSCNYNIRETIRKEIIQEAFEIILATLNVGKV